MTHPAAQDIESQPRLGPDPRDAEAGLIIFTDPSCPYCRDWASELYPALKQNLIDTGKLSYVVRFYPKVQYWANSATELLEGVYRRDEAAFWGLKRQYYQWSRERLRNDPTKAAMQWLEDNTDLDVDELSMNVSKFEYTSYIESDMAAAEKAEMTTIPSWAAFSDGSVHTTGQGTQSYSNMKTILGFE